MNKQENDKPTAIEDLPVDGVRQDEVKGGGQIWRNVGGTWTMLSSASMGS